MLLFQLQTKQDSAGVYREFEEKMANIAKYRMKNDPENKVMRDLSYLGSTKYSGIVDQVMGAIYREACYLAEAEMSMRSPLEKPNVEIPFLKREKKPKTPMQNVTEGLRLLNLTLEKYIEIMCDWKKYKEIRDSVYSEISKI